MFVELQTFDLENVVGESCSFSLCAVICVAAKGVSDRKRIKSSEKGYYVDCESDYDIHKYARSGHYCQDRKLGLRAQETDY